MPIINRESRKYLILGIHGADVQTVAGNVARVRMFVNNETVDEDFPLPKVRTIEELLDEAIMKRVAELEDGIQGEIVGP